MKSKIKALIADVTLIVALTALTAAYSLGRLHVGGYL